MASFWRQGTEFPVETCIFYNFGYNKDFPFPQINMDTAEFRIAIHTRGMAPPNRCSAVLISGKYLQQVDEVMQIVESVAHPADINPFAAFLFRQSEDEKIFINSTLRKRYSPTMVSPQKRKYVMALFSIQIFSPIQSGTGYISKVMCHGGVVNGKVYNKVTDRVYISKEMDMSGSSYKELCKVGL